MLAGAILPGMPFDVIREGVGARQQGPAWASSQGICGVQRACMTARC